MAELTKLIEDLLVFTGSSKTAYALELGLSPSTLSKLLAGTRAVSDDEFERLCHVSTSYFSNLIFSQHLQSSMIQLFPCICDFRTQAELYAFLVDAFHFYRGRDRDRELPMEAFSGGQLYTSPSRILHYLLLRLSERLKPEEPAEVTIYSTVWLPTLFSDDSFSRVRIHNPHGHRIILCQAFDAEVYEKQPVFDFLQSVEHLSEICELRFYLCEKRPSTPFILVPGISLLLFNQTMPMQPIMAIVRDFLYLTNSRANYLSYFTKRLTYEEEEMLEYLRRHTQEELDEKLKTFRCLTSFIPLGFALSRKLLTKMIGDEAFCSGYLHAFETAMRRSERFYLSQSITEQIMQTGYVYVPVFGRHYLEVNKRAEYLSHYRRFEELTGEKPRLLRMQRQLRFSCLLFFRDFLLVYMRAHNNAGERVHLLPLGKEKINYTLEQGLYREHSAPLDETAWQSFQRFFPL